MNGGLTKVPDYPYTLFPLYPLTVHIGERGEYFGLRSFISPSIRSILLAVSPTILLLLHFSYLPPNHHLMAYPQPRRYTWEEYLQLEAQSELRYEYFNGHVYCLAGAKTPHNEVASNCHDHLKRAARQQGCKAYLLEIKLFRRDGQQYFYPDGVVTCHPLDLQSKDGVRNPLLVVEVMSDGTRHRDQGIKLKEYLALDSLRHYLLIEQAYCLVQHYHRQSDGNWGFRNYDQLEAVVELPELDLSLRVGDLYTGVDLGEAPAGLEEPWVTYENGPTQA